MSPPPTKKLRSSNLSPPSKKIPSNFDGFPINDLPEEIISYILCLLPIKDAVKTSVLSRDWENRWTSMRDLTTGDRGNYFTGDHRLAEFACVVDKILSATNSLRTFHLTCHKKFHYSHLTTWIPEVLKRNVLNLVIEAPKGFGYLRLLPRWFERCTSLTELKLSVSNCTLALPTQSYLSNLKTLSLDGEFNGVMDILSHRSAYSGEGNVVLNFPVLESLQLRFCRWKNVKTVEIHAPNLITFKAACLPKQEDYSVKICGPKLATFESTDCIMEDYILNTPAVTFAALRHEIFTTSLPLRAHKVLKGFPELRRLIVSGVVVQALTQAKSDRVTPTFFNLKQLELSSTFAVEDLLWFLKVTPCLESLSLSMTSSGQYGDFEYDYEHDGVVNLPPCIKSGLKEVKFLGFGEIDNHVELVNFILKSAENLKNVLVVIERGRFWTKDVKNRLLSTLRPKSPNCVLKVKLHSTSHTT